MFGGKINLRHLRAFCSVATHRNISVASKEVFLSQPAITQAIAKLEKLTGTLLFDRRSNGMFLSNTGEIFFNRGARALKYIEQGARLTTKHAQGTEKTPQPSSWSRFDQLITSSQLRALLAVVDAGNFSLAARSIKISQPTLYRSARDLERICEIELFAKASHGIEVTGAARILAQHTQLAFSELDQGFDEIRQLLGFDVGRIVIGTLPLAQSFLLPTAVNMFLERHPDFEVSIHGGSYNDILQNMRGGKYDFLIGAMRTELPVGDIVQEPLFDDAMAIIGRSGHPLCKKDGVSIEELAHFGWVIPKRGIPVRKVFENLFKNVPEKPKIIEASSLVTTRGLLTGSDRLTIMSAHQIQVEEEQSLLGRLSFKLAETPRKIGLTFRKDWQPTKSQSLMLEILREVGSTIQENTQHIQKLNSRGGVPISHR